VLKPRIVKLLRTPRIMGVITKTDLVDDERADREREPVRVAVVGDFRDEHHVGALFLLGDAFLYCLSGPERAMESFVFVGPDRTALFV